MNFHKVWIIRVRVNTGPPTWWKPQFKIIRQPKSTEVRLGWLRACAQFSWGTTSPRG